MNGTSVQNEGGMVAATQELETILLQNGQDVEVILTLGQNCCAEIHRYFESSSQGVPVKAVLDSILVLKRSISCIAEKATTSEQKLSTLKHEFWHQSLYPTITSCCFNEKWHVVFIQNDPTPERSLHAAFQASIRDLFKEQLISFIFNVIASATPEAGISCIIPSLQFILDLATTAAELIGWRDRRVETAPYLRNYGLVNVLWMGVIKFWSSVPLSLRSQLAHSKQQNTNSIWTQTTNLSALSVMDKLLKFIRVDFSFLCERKLATDAKLLLFWTVQISKMLAAYPETAHSVWIVLIRWITIAHDSLLKMEAGENTHGAGREGATAAATASLEFVRAVDDGSLWQRLARVQDQALHLLPAPKRDSCIEVVRQELYKVRTSSFNDSLSNDNNNTLTTAGCILFSTVLEMVGEVKSVPAESRSAFLPLFKEVMMCIPVASLASALDTAKLRHSTADSILFYVLSLASAAAEEAGASESAQHAWEECQVFLMECSTIPHPYMLDIMRLVWSSLVSVSDGPVTKHFVAAMHDVLTAIAATEAGAAAAEGTYKPISPTTQQLTHLIGVLLASMPKKMVESFYERFLKFENQQDGVLDLCQLAALAAVLRAASLSTHTVPYGLIANLIMELRQVIERSVGTSLASQKKLSVKAELKQPGLYLPWLVDCLRASVETVESYYLFYLEDIKPAFIHDVLISVSKTCFNLLALSTQSSDKNTHYAPTTLRTLYLAWKLLPEHPPSTSELETLAPYMERFLHSPAAAAAIAELTPALSTLSSPPKIVFEALLGPSRSASLQFLGREAYVKYAKECPDENVLGALPRQWLDQTGTKLSDQGQPVMEKYLSRTCSSSLTSSAIESKQITNGVDAHVAREMEKVARESAAGLSTMKRKAMQVSAKREEAIQNNSMISAALRVVEAIENLHKVWVPLAENSGGDAVGVVQAVTQARDALAALLDQK